MNPNIKSHFHNILLFIAGLLIYSPSYANSPPTPEQILESAKLGQAKLVVALSETERLAPTFTTKEQLYPYITILTKLDEISAKYHFETLGSDPVKEFGFILTRSALKWLRIDLDPWDVVENFFIWSENNIRNEVAGQSLRWLTLVTEKTDLLLWNDRVTKVVSLITKIKTDIFVLEAYSELHGTIIQKLLALSKYLNREQLLDLIGSAKSTSSIQAVAAFLKEQILTTKDNSYLKTTLEWVNILGKNTNEARGILPYFICELPGALFNMILNRAFKLGVVLDPEPIALGVSLLQPSHCIELADSFRINFRDRAIPDSQVAFLAHLALSLKARFKVLGLDTTSEEIAAFWKRLIGLEQALNNDVEGTYAVEWGTWKGILTLAHVGSGLFFMSVNSVNQGNRINFPFFSVGYSEATDTWEAQKFAVGDPVYSPTTPQLYFLKAKFKKHENETTVDGYLLNYLGQFHITGRKTERFFTTNSQPAEAIPKPEGIYQGKSNETTLSLSLYSFTPRPLALLTVTTRDIPVYHSLPVGYYDTVHNVIYLSKINEQADSWILLKGQFSKEGNSFIGELISSDQGVQHRLQLEKTGNFASPKRLKRTFRKKSGTYSNDN